MISLIDPNSTGAGDNLVSQVARIFSLDGLLSKSKNFEYRPEQQEMAVAVAKALQGAVPRVEAGTGVAKPVLPYPGHSSRWRRR